MTTLRKAAQQALTILEAWKHKGMWGDWDGVTDTLRAALAEPVQEPVGFDQLIAETEADPVMRQTLADGRHWVAEQFYTIPHQRKPLTEEEISNIWDGHVVPVFGKNGINPIVFTRAIERAHGIS